ncbi:hypothetical protein LMG31506_03020 [Cupriavidus yeoncheonensis]|uniref:Toprim domain-containing protein n=1 Tax=Cupriavidus yeoncheonensis TaxID=1462994 RepID=A0A916IVY8_9BURK|nr:VapE domain-containing protein [Cupriavidus yeoncheonensis]CAG2144502.1 hypothetical protein LMG31506_03020 [Cupriavidus yeoncheonensis]
MSAAAQYRDLTEEEISAALAYIDANDRDTWVMMGMAIKSELGAAGFEVWDAWAQTAGNYSSKDARDVWKSIKQSGRTTIATLIHEAQQFGFRLNEAQREPIPAHEIEQRRTRREAELKQAEEEQARYRAEAARRANVMWESAQDIDGDGHPYLQRKSVHAYGLRLGAWRNGAENVLLVPMRDASGAIVSLQAVFPNENPQLGRDKDYLPGGQRRGSFHMIGDKPAHGSVIVVCEGYATGASIHRSTGYTVFVAFDAGNLRSVASALRQQFGHSVIVIAADDDRWTDGNPGMHHARQAATAAGGIVVGPVFADLSGKPKDFNDLHQREGIEAVREQVNAVVPKAANDSALPIDAAVNPFMFPHASDKQQPLNTWENLAWLMGEYGITARYNEIRKDVELTIPGRMFGDDNRDNCSIDELTSICSRNRMPVANLLGYVRIIADMNRYNPVADWIASKPWDGRSRLLELMDTVQSDMPPDLKDTLMLRWLISAVAACFMPHGFSSHGVLVFTGKQGLGKTSWFNRLVPNDLRATLEGAIVDPSNKDTVINAVAHWLVELGELDATFRKADIARLKAFVTQPVDKLRQPYDKKVSQYSRRTVFFASVNEDRYLVDDTGNRRWWTIPVTRINYNHGIDMQQVWAELLHLWRQGEPHWLQPDEQAMLNDLNAEHEAIDPLEEMLMQRFDWSRPQSGMEMTATEVLLKLHFDKPNKAQATHASKVLQRLTGDKPRKSGSRRLFMMPALVIPQG